MAERSSAETTMQPPYRGKGDKKILSPTWSLVITRRGDPDCRISHPGKILSHSGTESNPGSHGSRPLKGQNQEYDEDSREAGQVSDRIRNQSSSMNKMEERKGKKRDVKRKSDDNDGYLVKTNICCFESKLGSSRLFKLHY